MKTPPVQAGALSDGNSGNKNATTVLPEADSHAQVHLDLSVPIRRFPTRLHVICTCGHQAHVSTFIEKVPRLRCTICGNRNPRIAAADRSRSWSMRRKGR